MTIKLNTKYKPIDEEHTKVDRGYQVNKWIFRFENGYGASAICNTSYGRIMTYGSKYKPFELAVLRFYVKPTGWTGWAIDYTTPIADDVIGYLTEKEIEEILERIEKL